MEALQRAVVLYNGSATTLALTESLSHGRGYGEELARLRKSRGW
jgi:hypothetical protein